MKIAGRGLLWEQVDEEAEGVATNDDHHTSGRIQCTCNRGYLLSFMMIAL